MFAFGGEKRFQAASARFLRHARARVGDPQAQFPVVQGSVNAQGAALRHGIDGVEDQIGEHLAQFGRIARQRGQLGCSALDIDLHAARPGLVLPLGPGHGDGLLDDLVKLEGYARFLALVGPVEFPQSAHDLRGVLRGGGDRADVPGFRVVGPGFCGRHHQVAVAEDHRQRVVEIVRDARRHRAEGAEALLFDGGVLGGPQFEKSVFQLRSALADLFFEEDVLVLELDVQEAVFQQVANAQQHLGLVERLGQEILGPGGERAVLGLGGHVGGEDQHGHGIFGGGKRLDLLHDVEAGDIGHVEVRAGRGPAGNPGKAPSPRANRRCSARAWHR